MNLPSESRAKNMGVSWRYQAKWGAEAPNNGGTAEAELFRPLYEDGGAILFSKNDYCNRR